VPVYGPADSEQRTIEAAHPIPASRCHTAVRVSIIQIRAYDRWRAIGTLGQIGVDEVIDDPAHTRAGVFFDRMAPLAPAPAINRRKCPRVVDDRRNRRAQRPEARRLRIVSMMPRA